MNRRLPGTLTSHQNPGFRKKRKVKNDPEDWHRHKVERAMNRNKLTYKRIPEEDRYLGGAGQSYRPGNVRERSPRRSPPYRNRSPPRRTDYVDSYRAPPRGRSRDEYRHRSPSPPRRADSYRARSPRHDEYRRPRSPPRREELPKTDLFRREPVRDTRDFRDPQDYRDVPARSPHPRYNRSPASSRGRRTPPRVARYESPPRRRYSPDPRDRRPSPPRSVTRDYRPRSRSPPARNDRIDPRAVDDWRRRSPVRDLRQDLLREESAANSAATSRRSSPPAHPSRMAIQPAFDDRPRSRRASPRDPYDTREPYRAGDPETKPRYVPPSREPAYDDDRGYPNGGRDLPPPREPKRDDVDVPPPRVPPTGPSSQRTVSASMAPPSGPAAVNAPLGPRAVGPPPAGPRGAVTPRGDFSGRGRGGFGSDFVPRGRGGYSMTFRGGRGGAAPLTGPGFGRGDATFARSPEAMTQEPSFASRPPPAGPRNSFSQSTPPTFRQSSASSSAAPSGPRAQRFQNGDVAMTDAPTGPKAARRPTEAAVGTPVHRPHPVLADLPKIIEGGQKAEPLIDRTRLNRLEDEAEKLRRQIEEKETRKRKSLREWDRMTRESEIAALRSELAEQALKELNGEAESQAAF